MLAECWCQSCLEVRQGVVHLQRVVECDSFHVIDRPSLREKQGDGSRIR